jgi:hypothetical protein
MMNSVADVTHQRCDSHYLIMEVVQNLWSLTSVSVLFACNLTFSPQQDAVNRDIVPVRDTYSFFGVSLLVFVHA